MATSNPDQNRSQFFITFDAADNLYKKHTLFGKVVGESLFNLQAMEKVTVDDQDCPLHSVMILTVRVETNPFPDIFPRDQSLLRALKAKVLGLTLAPAKEPLKNKSPRPPPIRSFNLLSFGDSEAQEEAPESLKPHRVICPHDILADGSLQTAPEEETLQELSKRAQKLVTLDSLKGKASGEVLGKRPPPGEQGEESLHPETRLKELIKEDLKTFQEGKDGARLARDKQTGEVRLEFDRSFSRSRSSSTGSSSSETSSEEEEADPELKKLRQKQKEAYSNIQLEGLQFKDGPGGGNLPEEEKSLLTAVELKRYKFLKANKKGGPEEVMSKLDAFKKKLASGESKGRGSAWMAAKPKFVIDSSKAYSLQENRTKAMEAFGDQSSKL